jgi:dolichol-phosphate mannosyltransferase
MLTRDKSGHEFPDKPVGSLVAALPAELTVVVPTMNERDNIAPLVARLDHVLDGIAWEVVFVDDDSPDCTADAIHAIARRDPRVRVIQRIGRRGLSSACVEGVLCSSAPYVVIMDADLQHDETMLPTMLARLKADDLDLIIGSRYVPGGSTEGWALHRLLISQFAVRVAQTFFKVKLKDPMSGFFLLRREAFDGAVRQLSQWGFKILFDLVASSPRPLKFIEIPYRFGSRQYGTSKLDSSIAWQFGVLILDKLVGRYVPVRFLMFALVGGTGVVVHLAALYLLLRGNLSFDLAQTGAVLVAMTSNFILNNLITYHDQRLRGVAFLRGLLSFYAVCAVGAVANVGVARLLYAEQSIWWAAGLAGALVGVVWNYAASRLFTWNPRDRS